MLSLPVCDYFFIEPRYTLFMHNSNGDLVTLAVLLAMGIALSALIERFRQTREKLQRTAFSLEQSELRFRTLAATTPEMLFTATAEGDIDYVSERFADYTGITAEILRTEWPQVLHPEDRRRVAEQWSKSVASGTEFEVIYRIRREDGEYRWFKVHAKSICDASGRITQWSGVSADIHEQKVLEQELLLRTQEVMASKEAFQTFAWRVCHDLTEPLRSIRVFTELLERRDVQKTDEELRKVFGHIVGSADLAQQQILQLLEYAKAGSLEIRREMIDLSVVAEAAAENLASMIAETGATVTHGDLPRLVLNADRMRSVFQNLIGNALKYRSTRVPRIHISARLQNGEWIIAVEDNGIGFDMQYAAKIFEAFERITPAGYARGSGLGLAIVKQLIQGKGGRVWAESEPGTGSTFYFSLPRSLETMPPARRAAALERAAGYL